MASRSDGYTRLASHYAAELTRLEHEHATGDVESVRARFESIWPQVQSGIRWFLSPQGTAHGREGLARAYAGGVGRRVVRLLVLGRPRAQWSRLQLHVNDPRERGSDHLSALLDLAAACTDLGKLRSAEKIYLRAHLQAVSIEHPVHAAEALEGLGRALFLDRRHAEAIAVVSEAIRRYSADVQPSGRVPLAPYALLGAILLARGEPARAEDLLEPVARELVDGDDAGRTREGCEILLSLGRAKRILARTSAAVSLLERSVEMIRAFYGEDHEQLVLPLNELALAYQVNSQPELARDTLVDALRIEENARGPSYPGLAVRLANLGILCRESDELAQSLEYLDRAQEILARASHWNISRSYAAQVHRERARTFIALRDPTRARSDLASATRILRVRVSAEHPSWAALLFALGCYCELSHRMSAALCLHERAARTRWDVFGAHHPETRESLEKLAELRAGMARNAPPSPSPRAVGATGKDSLPSTRN